MEFYNPLNELEDLKGVWEGTIYSNESKTKSSLIIKTIGHEIFEFNSTITKEDKELLFEKNILFYDKAHELLKAISINHEGYIEFADLEIRSKKKEIIIKSVFSSGFNLPPNIKILKTWLIDKKTNLINYKVKMGKEESVILTAEYSFQI